MDTSGQVVALHVTHAQKAQPPRAPRHWPPSKKFAATLAEEEAHLPGRPVAALCTDEHRIGPKPIECRIWAPSGQRPTALGYHRYEWLYGTAFVAPATSESYWYVGNGVSKPLFERLPALFVNEAGVGERRTVILLLHSLMHVSQRYPAVLDRSKHEVRICSGTTDAIAILR
ncbi:hypothetical protein CRT23_27330 [Methylobacterium sp. V23]|nr:hypothetical protein CRT23_27330 [Methylobacterium sp. V23]